VNRAAALHRVQQPVLVGRPDAADATLTVQIFTYAIAPYEDGIDRPGLRALVLVTIVLLCSLVAGSQRRGWRDCSGVVRKGEADLKVRPYANVRSVSARPLVRRGSRPASVSCGIALSAYQGPLQVVHVLAADRDPD